MSLSMNDLLTALETTDLPVCYNAFPEGYAPSLPWIVIHFTESAHFLADNEIYNRGERVDIEYYNTIKSTSTELLIREALDNLGLIYDEVELTIESENVIEHVYSVTLN